MIKDFDCYKQKQHFSNGFTQWEKTYSDGQIALVCIDDSRVTRSLVKSAFKAQELDLPFGQVFTREAAEEYMLPN